MGGGGGGGRRMTMLKKGQHIMPDLQAMGDKDR